MSLFLLKSFALVGIAVLVGFALVLQRQAGRVLHVEVEALRAENREVSRLRAEQERLMATQVSPEERSQLLARRAELGRLREAIQAWREQARQAERGVDAPVATPSPADEMVDVAVWRNAGWSTPAAALETVLWASAGGDLETLARSFVFDPAALARAQALLEGLPETARASYATPEHLIALFTVKDVPLGAMQVQKVTARGADEAVLRVRLRSPEGKIKDADLTLRRDADDAWRLVVPESAVQRYERALKRAVQPAASR